MAFTRSIAQQHFLDLSHDEKVVKVITIMDSLRDSSPLFADLYATISRKDFTMTDQELQIYYSIVMTYISTIDSLQTTIEKARIMHAEQLHHMEENDQASADDILTSL